MRDHSREYATIGSPSRPSPAFLTSVGKLLRLMNEQLVPCAVGCGARASRVLRMKELNTVCQRCATRYHRAGPIDRRRMQLDVARAAR